MSLDDTTQSLSYIVHCTLTFFFEVVFSQDAHTGKKFVNELVNLNCV